MKAYLCVGFSTTDWEKLDTQLDHDGPAWEKAIDVFERRIKERFFTCIDALIAADSRPYQNSANPFPAESHCTPGFSIVALCCLLVETLQSFREKAESLPTPGNCAYPTGARVKTFPTTSDQFITFLKRPAFHGAFDGGVGQKFVRGIRNGILHEAKTRRWLIRRDVPGSIVTEQEDGHVLNRTLFYNALKQEFESYLKDLRHSENEELRARFREKMREISEDRR